MRIILKLACNAVFLICISNPVFSQSKKELKLHDKANEYLLLWQNPITQWSHVGEIKIDTFSISAKEKTISVQFSPPLSYIPAREEIYLLTLSSLEACLGEEFKKYDIRIITDGQLWETLIPNYYRKSMDLDQGRYDRGVASRTPIVRRIDREMPAKGLYSRNIALWHSHGWYYEATLDRWEWQRARLYSTVEDIFPMTFVLPYLVPMLENAGANVFLPRERDLQVNEVIVDNDQTNSSSEIIFNGINPTTINTTGFMEKDTLYNLENPFVMGSHLRFRATKNNGRYIEYIPDIPEEGDYAVYISYQQSPENSSDGHYTVSHSGGKTSFLVNQKMGGGTWVFLGNFHFKNGRSADSGSVRIDSFSNENGWITTDAIKFGGGMGSVARKPSAELTPNEKSLRTEQKNIPPVALQTNIENFQWKISHRPRYTEGARYYLQYAGFPDTLVYNLSEGKNDYYDDYQSRGEWVNYLAGAPGGPNANRNAEGLNIPIDLALAFHTDAGVTPKDSIVGTLSILSSARDDGKFPNGQSKLISRDLSDIIQTEIVRDIRLQFTPDWTRRAMWNKQYSEAWRPNVPSMLLELLSHQNLSDMRFGLDPRFKFAVSRSIYKGIVKFLAFQNNAAYVIQPLPVDHFSIQKTGPKSIKLSWGPVLDSLEPSAIPQKFKVYKRVGANGFDNGQIIDGNSIEMELENFGEIYSFKVTAINEGGESFPSEILAVGLLGNDKKPILVVNGFDRIAAPVVIDEGNFAGLAQWNDEGVPDKYNIGYTGEQYDYDRNSPWLDDDSPGWGASYGNMEGKLIPGNSFDNTVIHGKSIINGGYSFVSAGDEVFSNPDFDLSPFQTIDLIFGEEKTTKIPGGKLFEVFDQPIRQKITDFTQKGGNIFVSGAFIGSDFILNKDTVARDFAQNILHFRWRTNHAVKLGEVYSTDYANGIVSGSWNFNTIYHPTIYKVEAPDGIEPFGEGAISAFRYRENNASAGTAFHGAYKTVALGFPFETIVDESERDKLMKQILNYFDK